MALLDSVYIANGYEEYLSGTAIYPLSSLILTLVEYPTFRCA